MALSNLALFGGAFFTPVNIRNLGGPTISISNHRIGDSRKDHPHYRSVISYGISAILDDADFVLR